MYGPVRTVVWQGSAGDRRPYADQTRLWEVKGMFPVRLGILGQLCAIYVQEFIRRYGQWS